MSHQKNDFDYLAELIETPTPAFINDLPPEQLHELREYVEAVIARDEAGLDKLFESMSMMMKFIPNFILHTLTPKYTEPAIAARITRKLTIKQSQGVTAGLPADYIGETSVFMEPALAAEIIQGLKKAKVIEVIKYMAKNHPLKSLDILEHASPDIIAISKDYAYLIKIDEHNLSETRKATLDRINIS